MKDVVQIMQQVNQFHREFWQLVAAFSDPTLIVQMVENQANDYPIAEVYSLE